VEVSDGIHLLFQPAYSPEVQPAERLWAVTDEVLANADFDTIDELVHAQEDQCAHIAVRPAGRYVFTHIVLLVAIAGLMNSISDYPDSASSALARYKFVWYIDSL
jgi:hypothetical protein